MERKSLDKLGYFDVLAAAAQCTAFPPAREAVLNAAPLTDAAALADLISLVGEAMDCLQRGLDLPGAGAIEAEGILAVLRQAHAVLMPGQLVQLGALCTAADQFRAFRRQAEKHAPRLAGLCGTLTSLAELRGRLAECVEQDGHIADAASDELRQVRRRLKSGERERQTAIEKITRRLFDAGRLQDNYHTIRGEDRIVVPVKAGEHTRVPGILHDVSQSGETYFIEPAEIVTLTNELFSLRAREEVEVAKVLRTLTEEARPHTLALEANVAALTHLETIFARARFGEQRGWRLCEVGGAARPLDLHEAHHPLLALSRPQDSQPNTFALAAGDRAVVISGPNAGGKTTLLKMAGLCAALAQAAVPLPLALGSHTPLFDAILADIGDEQDIAAGVSSFSAHVRNLTRIMKKARGAALVLLDEIGGSTDPEEGAALAAGVIEALAAQGALVLATSHYTVLKEWAHKTPGACNVSFYLDAATHKPVFNLMMDVPGVSEAFTVAREEGLPEEALRRAAGHVNPERRRLNDLLVEMQTKDAELRRLQRENEEMAGDLERERAEVEALQEELGREKRTFRQEMLRAKEAELRQMRGDLEQIIAKQPTKETLEKARRAMAAIQKETAQEREAVETMQIRFVASGRLRPGMQLKIRDMSDPAEIISVDQKKERAQVRVGVLEMTVKFSDIEGAVKQTKAHKEERARREGGAATPRYTVNRATLSVPLELDLHGKRVEEALDMADKYLSDAVVANLPQARILHGIGTGALRSAIREMLQTHPLVKSWRAGTPDEGGLGSTTVYFKD